MKQKIRLVQISHSNIGRKVALVEEPSLILLEGLSSVYDLAAKALNDKKNIETIIEKYISNHRLQYDVVYNGFEEWRMLPSFDCPENPANCLVSGTGLIIKIAPQPVNDAPGPG